MISLEGLTTMSKKFLSFSRHVRIRKLDIIYIIGLLSGLLLIASIYFINLKNTVLPDFPVRRIYGMNFSLDSNLYLATSGGLRVYSDIWSVSNLPRHDYEGYSGTGIGFYSSGHPEHNSNLPDPLGLLKSENYEGSIELLNFSGEAHFHIIGASYYDVETLYIFNDVEIRSLSTGLQYTYDGAESWRVANSIGLNSIPRSIAVHPNDGSIVVATTDNADVLISTNFGNTFERIQTDPVSSASFSTFNDDILFLGHHELFQFAFNDNTFESVKAPILEDGEVILYIASDPNNERIAIATNWLNIYIQGEGLDAEWEHVLIEGNTK